MIILSRVVTRLWNQLVGGATLKFKSFFGSSSRWPPFPSDCIRKKKIKKKMNNGNIINNINVKKEEKLHDKNDSMKLL